MSIVENIFDQYYLYQISLNGNEQLIMRNSDLDFTKKMKNYYLRQIAEGKREEGTIIIKLHDEEIDTKIAVNIFVRNSEGNILAVSRKDDHTAFGLPGGKYEKSDITLKNCAKREFFEETGLSIDDLKLIYVHDDDYNYVNFTFTGNISGEINTQEAGIVKWVSKETLLNGPFGFYNKLLFDYFL